MPYPRTPAPHLIEQTTVLNHPRYLFNVETIPQPISGPSNQIHPSPETPLLTTPHHPHLLCHTRPCKPPQSNKHTPNQPINPVNPRPQSILPKKKHPQNPANKNTPVQPDPLFANLDHSFSPGSKTTFSKYLFFLFQFQAHPCPSLPPPCPVCCLPALNLLTHLLMPIPTPCKYLSLPKLLKNYFKTKPSPSKSSF